MLYKGPPAVPGVLFCQKQGGTVVGGATFHRKCEKTIAKPWEFVITTVSGRTAEVPLHLRFKIVKTMRPAEIFKTRGIYNEEVIGNAPDAGHGTGTVQRELGGDDSELYG